MDELHQKYSALRASLAAMGRVAVAFSSGVDSTFLLWTAHDVLGDGAIAVTARACLFPAREQAEAAGFCRQACIRQITVDVDALAVPGLAQNPADRCYLCKRALFERMRAAAAEQGIACLAEGSNVDDTGDYRPGLRAIRELGIKSPLREAGLYKWEIRALSRELGLPTWDKPSYACLASRFVYGEEITPEKLSRVEQAEALLLEGGFPQMRVRVHGDLARIEVPPEALPRFLAFSQAGKLPEQLRRLGFSYVTLDLDGYRTGSMNEVLTGREARHG